MDVPDPEVCGRGVWDSNKAKDPINARIFRQPDGVREISVDRLSIADLDALVALHDRERGPDKPFKGWGALTAAEARSVNCSVVEDRQPDNIWHANIIMPSANDEIMKQISTSLATMARWRPRKAAISQPPITQMDQS